MIVIDNNDESDAFKATFLYCSPEGPGGTENRIRFRSNDYKQIKGIKNVHSIYKSVWY